MGCLISFGYDKKADQDKEVEYIQMDNIQLELQRHNNKQQYQSLVYSQNKFVSSDFVHDQKTQDIGEIYILYNPPIGKGTFGEVRKAQHKYSKLVVAIKQIDKQIVSIGEIEKYEHEMNMIKKLDHPNIIKIHQQFHNNKFLYIVTEYCSGGDLQHLILKQGKIKEPEACRIFQQILSAIYYCHKNNIFHRDIKAENVMFENKSKESQAILIDFGSSVHFENSDQTFTDTFGTAYYVAPEVLNNKYNYMCDVWSLGILLYYMLSGDFPFYGRTEKRILDNIIIGKYSFDQKVWLGISEDAKNLISSLLAYNPKNRITAENALRSSWFQKFQDNQMNFCSINRALNSMKNLETHNAFQDCTWTFLTNYLSDPDQKKDLLNAFKDIDKDKDGQLTKQELIQGNQLTSVQQYDFYWSSASKFQFIEELQVKLSSIIRFRYRQCMKDQNISEQDLVNLVDLIFLNSDKNENNMIDYSEFVSATINRKQLLSESKLKQAFQMFDLDHNNYISLHELEVIFGKQIGYEEWQKMMQGFSFERENEVSFVEFKQMMEKLKF